MKMKTEVVVGFLSLVFVSFLIGCSSSFCARRDWAIQDNEDSFGRFGGVRQYLYQGAQRALSTVTPKSLAKPQIATALMIRSTDGDYSIAVSWIENYPSMDGVEVRIDGQDTVWFVSMPQRDIERNRRVAQKTILFGFCERVMFGADVSRNLEQSKNEKGLMVRLLHEKVAATEWFPVRWK